MKRLLLFPLCILLLCRSLLSGQVRTPVPTRKYAFSHINSTNGLASNIIHNVVQDDQGYMWLATINGLQRYDGHSFISFKSKAGDPATIPHDYVAALYKDRSSNIWVYTGDQRIGLFNTRTFRYREVPVKWVNAANHFYEKRIKETHDGKLILAARKGGNYVYDRQRNQFVSYPALYKTPEKWLINDWFLQPGTSRYWIASDSGLAVFDASTGQLSYRGHNAGHIRAIDELGALTGVLGVHINRQGKTLLHTWPTNATTPALVYYDSATGKRKIHALSKELYNGNYYEIRDFMSQSNGRLWVYGSPLLLEYEGGNNDYAVSDLNTGAPGNHYDIILSLYEDRDHNVWACTDNGLYTFNPDAQLFHNYNLQHPDGSGAGDAVAQAVLMLQNGQIWVSTWGRGNYFFDRHLAPVAPPPALATQWDTCNSWCMLEHRKTGFIWMGMQGGSMLVYDPRSGRSVHFNHPLFRSTIRQVTEDRQGNVWIGTQAGQIVKWRFRPGLNDVSDGFTPVTKGGTVTKLITAGDGYVWAAAMVTGVSKIDPVQNRIIRQFSNTSGRSDEQLSGESASDILTYNDSTLLIANGVLDIIHTRTNKVTHITSEDGLPSSTIVCLQKDSRGIIWAGLSNGLYRINLQQKTFTLYDRRDGISYDNFRVASAFRLANGLLAFTTDHNFLVFNPLEDTIHQPPPDIRITEVQQGDHAIAFDSVSNNIPLTVNYDNTTVAIAFSGLQYLHQKRIQYEYRMNGLDKHWKRAGNVSRVTYHYLPPGRYTFQVRTVDANGIAGKTVATYAVHVLPPFWRTWWFYALIALVVITIFYLIDKERIRRLQALQQMRKQIADDLHQDIHTTLSNINLLSEIAKIKADKDVARSKEYIDQIRDKSGKMIVAMDDILWSIAPENDNVQMAVARMKEFTEALESRYGTVIELIVDKSIDGLSVEMKIRHQLLFLFKEMISLIVIQGQGQHTSITIDYNKNKLALKVQDKTASLDNNPALARMLYELQKRTELIGGELDSHNDRMGIFFILLIPLQQ